MKKIVLLFFIFFAITARVDFAKASTIANPVYTFIVSKSYNSSDRPRIDDTPFGHRIPPKPQMCTIDYNGRIMIDNNVVNVYHIYIYDESGILITSLSDSINLIDVLSQSVDLYNILLVTDCGDYSGQLTI